MQGPISLALIGLSFSGFVDHRPPARSSTHIHRPLHAAHGGPTATSLTPSPPARGSLSADAAATSLTAVPPPRRTAPALASQAISTKRRHDISGLVAMTQARVAANTVRTAGVSTQRTANGKGTSRRCINLVPDNASSSTAHMSELLAFALDTAGASAVEDDCRRCRQRHLEDLVSLAKKPAEHASGCAATAAQRHVMTRNDQGPARHRSVPPEHDTHQLALTTTKVTPPSSLSPTQHHSPPPLKPPRPALRTKRTAAAPLAVCEQHLVRARLAQCCREAFFSQQARGSAAPGSRCTPRSTPSVTNSRPRPRATPSGTSPPMPW